MHTNTNAHSERILSICPARHGLGYVVLETNPLRLVDWKARRCRKDNGTALAVVKGLIHKFRPTQLLLPDWRDTGHPLRRPALEAFIEAIAEVLTFDTLPILTCSRTQLRAYFEPLGAHTKLEIAELLGMEFPELKRSVPKKRQIWERERPVQSVFDALAMAVAVLKLEYRPADAQS